MKTIKCVKCGEYKSQDEYYKRSPSAGKGFHRDCKECAKKKSLETFRASRFGITLDKYLEMVEEQNKQCAICGAPHSDEKWKVLVVDHDHETGNIRGLLCMTCNKALGYFRDNINNLRNAIKYLEDNG